MNNYLNGFSELTSQIDRGTCYVLDTNYLLDSLSSVNFSEQYFTAILENDSTIFIPFIVWVEFNYNVQKVLEQTEGFLEQSNNFLKEYKPEKLQISKGDIKTKFDNIFNKKIIEDNMVGQTISSNITEFFNKKIDDDSDLGNIINSLNNKTEEILKSWEEEFQADLNAKIQDHINKAKDLLSAFNEKVNNSDTNILIGNEYTKEDLKKKIQVCQLREKNKLYPGNAKKDLEKEGYKIWKDLEIPQKYGDMLLWLELIEFAKKHQNLGKFIIVSNDTEKEDWVLKKSKKLFPQLSIEFYTKTSGSIVDHMKSFDFVTEFSPGTSHEELKKDYILQREDSVLDFEDIPVIDEPVSDLFDDIDFFDYSYKDTIVVPAKIAGFKEVFLGENRWYSINIRNDRIPYLKYIAAYQSHPVSAVTYIAKIDRIVDSPYKPGKKMIVFDGIAKQLKHPIPLGENYLALQSPRYTNHKKLNTANTTDDLFDFTNLFDGDF